MGWQRLSRDDDELVPYADVQFLLDPHTSLREMADCEKDASRGLHSVDLVVVPMEPGESLKDAGGIAFSTTHQRTFLWQLEQYKPLQAAEARRALARVFFSESVSLPELDDLLEEVQARADAVGARYETFYADLSTGSSVVVVAISAVTQVAGAVVSFVALQAAFRRHGANLRYRRLRGREAEAIQEARRESERRITGSQSWVVGQVVLEKDRGVFSITLVHPKDTRKTLTEARWASFEIQPHGDRVLYADLVRSNRVNWNAQGIL